MELDRTSTKKITEMMIMVNVQVWWNEIQDGGKIASYPCGEADVTGIVADFEAEYGAVKQIVVDDGDVCNKKGNPQYRFHLFAEKHYLLVTVTKKQFERLFDTMTDGFEKHISETYGVMDRIFDRKTGDEKMTENCGYDRDFVLLETGEFKCGRDTFTYEGEPITVGDVLDHKIQIIDFNVTKEGHKGCFILMETGHILCRVSHYNRYLRHLFSTDEIVYAPTFSEIYPTASDFIESRIELLNTYQPTKEFKEKVDYCSYKGRLFKDLVTMSEAELEAIDNEEASAEIPMSDVEDYVNFLIEDAPKPHNWVEGFVADEEHIDYRIRKWIDWGIHYCEKYCSPSVEFFRLAQEVYRTIKENGEEMVEVEIWKNSTGGEELGRIEKFSCKESQVGKIVADFEESYGTINEVDIGAVEVNAPFDFVMQFVLSSDTHWMWVTTTDTYTSEGENVQGGRLLKIIVTDDFEKVAESECMYRRNL